MPSIDVEETLLTDYYISEATSINYFTYVFVYVFEPLR